MQANNRNATIIGAGSYIPEQVISNRTFLDSKFYDQNTLPIQAPTAEVIAKFEEITGIGERRYAPDNLLASDMASIAANRAITDAGVDRESVDQIIVAHNFGDVAAGNLQSDTLPSLASKVKHKLRIENANCVAYDLIFGCPGWLQGLIHADSFIKAGVAKRCLIVGTEVLSRVLDPHDRDSMIFSDGAGAVVVEACSNGRGVLSTSSLTHADEETSYLSMGKSNSATLNGARRYVKMQGRKIYEYALNIVPEAMKCTLDRAHVDVSEVRKIFIHQANEKMDEAIVRRFFRLYGIREYDKDIMPMSINELGNSSVATIPTLIDLVKSGKYPQHKLESGDVVMLASVGAGMHVNAVVHRM